MIGFKPGEKARRIMQAASSSWWRRTRRSVLSSGKPGRFRVRGKLFAQKAAHSQGAKGAAVAMPLSRRVAVSPPKWGVMWRAWWGGLAESGLFMIVEGFIILRSGIGFLRELWFVGQEILARRVLSAPVDLASFKQEVLEGRLRSGSHHAQTRGGNWESVASEEGSLPGESVSAVHPVGLREEVERAKISFLDIEEEDLAEEELVDQAGALRSRLAAVTHEVAKE